MKREVFLFVLFAFLLVSIVFILSYKTFFNKSVSIAANLSENYVSRVIDGDTLELASGERVRLICIDTPEKGKKGYEEAKIFLESLVLNKSIRLEKDISEKDEYGRLLRYVYVGDLFVNKEIVQKGYATVFAYGNDTKRCKEIASS